MRYLHGMGTGTSIPNPAKPPNRAGRDGRIRRRDIALHPRAMVIRPRPA